jgi:hypothetical protein
MVIFLCILLHQSKGKTAAACLSLFAMLGVLSSIMLELVVTDLVIGFFNDFHVTK